MSNAIETAKFLRRYQSWRKGEIDVFYPDSHAGPNPVEISVAIDRAIVALEAQPPCGADGVWRPIETAPLDGRAVLVMSDNWPGTKSGRAETCNGHNTYVAEWWAESNEWMCYMSLPCEPVCPIAPTHWMPLPDVPSSQPAAPLAPAAVAVPDEWREILAELADDVKCNVAAEYPPETRHYPSQKRRFDEAMEIVLRAEAMLAASQREGGGT